MTLTQNNTKYKYISKLPILKGHRKPLGFFGDFQRAGKNTQSGGP